MTGKMIEGPVRVKRRDPNRKHYHIMMLPATVLLMMFSIVPMFGIVMAFQEFKPKKGFFGSPWVGLDQFEMMFTLPDVRAVIWNTVVIAVLKIVLGLLVQIAFAVALNEISRRGLKRTIQTAVYLPHFISWVILAEIIRFMFSGDGFVNQIIGAFGGEPILFLASNQWFQGMLIFTDTWKEFGWGAIVYLSAITSISPNLYDACRVDGGNKWSEIRHVTLPGISATIVLMAVLSLGNVLSAGFDQVFNLYSPIVYQTGDIIDTYVYRIGLQGGNYSFATAVGLFKSLISFALIVISYTVAYKAADYKVF